MPANIASFVKATGTANPWWGVGQSIDANASIENWMKSCGLDYRVVRKNIWMEENGAKIKLDGFTAIVKSSDGSVFQIASNKYKPIQNDEVLAVMKHYADTHQVTLDTMGSLGDNGAIIWGLAKLNDDFELAGGDEVQAYLLLASSHDGSLQWTGMLTFVRVVCQNTLNLALSDKKSKNLFSKKHTKNLDVKTTVEQAKADMELMRKSVARAKSQIQAMAETKISEIDKQILVAKLTNNSELLEMIAENRKDANASLLDQIVSKSNRGTLSLAAIEAEQTRTGKSILDAIVNSPGSDLESARDTVWGWLNGVTYYTDNQSGSDANRMKSAWFGPNANLKDQAYELAWEYVSTQQ